MFISALYHAKKTRSPLISMSYAF